MLLFLFNFEFAKIYTFYILTKYFCLFPKQHFKQSNYQHLLIKQFFIFLIQLLLYLSVIKVQF